MNLRPAPQASYSHYGFAGGASLLFAIALFLGSALGHWLTTTVAAMASLALLGLAPLQNARRHIRQILVPRATPVMVGLLGGLGLAVFTSWAYSALGSLSPSIGTEVVTLYALLNAPPGKVAGIPLLALVVLAEEIIWRGVLFRALEQHVSTTATVVISAIAYALPQLAGGSWLLPLVALGCGMFWAIERAMTRSLVAPLLSHLVWGLLIFVFMPLDTV